ncbi:MAG: histidine-type phosphatase [Bacteroidales bacterium]|nr:histidine-type phosphatase [Bacteroidales bacterium]
MKKLLALLLLVPLAAVAQEQKNPEIVALIHGNLHRAGVNTSPYEYVKTPETPVPAGYKPFYISHYGRHGSRTEWSRDNYASLVERWDRLADAGNLTPEGEAAHGMVNRLVAVHNGMDGRLTPRGAREHREIAARMYRKYKSVFRKGSRRVRAISSTAPRCLVSMAAATAELLSLDPRLDLSWDTGEKIMLICSTEDTKDIKKQVYATLDERRASHVPDTAAFLAKLLKDPSRARELSGNPVKLMQDTFDLASVSAACDMDDSLLRCFTEDDLYWYSQVIGMNMYLRQCNSREYGDKRMEPVHYLVEDVIAKADEAIATQDCAADLRYGHEYQLLAFSSRIGIKGIAERLDAVGSRDWPGVLRCPFACNLQMVFYRNCKGDVLVKCFLNEQEATIITLEGGPYYKWEDLRESILRNDVKNL